MKPYDVWWPVVGNLQEIRSEHLATISGSGYEVIDGPFIERNHKGSIHRYVVERIKR